MFTNITRRSIAPLLAVALVAIACGKKDAATDEAGRDIELTPQTADAPLNDQAMPTAEPTPANAPATQAPAPKPVATRPAAATPRAPARATSGTIAAGTSFAVTNGERICTNSHKVGDRFTTTLGSEVTGTNGVRIPAGAVVTLAVTESQISKNSKDNWKLAFSVVSVTVDGETMDVQGDVTKVATIEAVRSQSTGQQVGKVATGAAIGAIAGQVLGKNTKSTVVGAAVGAAAGGAVAAGTADYEGCLPANGTITIALSAPLTLKAGG
jgi:hypothetical protein